MEQILGNVDEIHVIYDQDTLLLHGTFPTRKAALARARKLERANARRASRSFAPKPYNYKLVTKSYYDLLAPKTKIVKHLLNGNEIEIPFNTPASCDPSTETYHCM